MNTMHETAEKPGDDLSWKEIKKFTYDETMNLDDEIFRLEIFEKKEMVG